MARLASVQGIALWTMCSRYARSLIIQAKPRKKKIFCCCINIKKHFDSILRERLWPVLAGLGLVGPLLQGLQIIYAQDSLACSRKMAVRSSSHAPQASSRAAPLVLFSLFCILMHCTRMWLGREQICMELLTDKSWRG